VLLFIENRDGDEHTHDFFPGPRKFPPKPAVEVTDIIDQQ
jgi:hypothetical protein